MLRFSPTAWAKLLFLRDLGPTEVGGFGITESEDLLFVNDFVLVEQRCTETFTSLDDVAVAEFFEQQVDLGRQPQEFGRIWIHTHPGSCPQPSPTDHRTFQRVFGGCDWAVMFILARGGETFADLHWRQGGPARIPLDVEIDFSVPFAESDHVAWSEEYATNVQPECWATASHFGPGQPSPSASEPDADYADLFAEPWAHDEFSESVR